MSDWLSNESPETTGLRAVTCSNWCVAAAFCKLFGVDDESAIMALHLALSPEGGSISTHRILEVFPKSILRIGSVCYARHSVISGLVRPDYCFHISHDSGDMFHCSHATSLDGSPLLWERYYEPPTVQVGSTHLISRIVASVKRGTTDTRDVGALDREVRELASRYLKGQYLTPSQLDAAIFAAKRLKGDELQYSKGISTALHDYKKSRSDKPSRRPAATSSARSLARNEASRFGPMPEEEKKEEPEEAKLVAALATPSFSTMFLLDAGTIQYPLRGMSTIAYDRLKTISLFNTHLRLEFSGDARRLFPFIVHPPKIHKSDFQSNVVADSQKLLTAVVHDLVQSIALHSRSYSYAEVGGDGQHCIMMGASRIKQYSPRSLRYPLGIGETFPQVCESPELLDPQTLVIAVHYQNVLSPRATSEYTPDQACRQVFDLIQQRRSIGKSTFVFTHAVFLAGLKPTQGMTIDRPTAPVYVQGRLVIHDENPTNDGTFESYEAAATGIVEYVRYRWSAKLGRDEPDSILARGNLMRSSDFQVAGGKRLVIATCGLEHVVFTFVIAERVGRELGEGRISRLVNGAHATVSSGEIVSLDSGSKPSPPLDSHTAAWRERVKEDPKDSDGCFGGCHLIDLTTSFSEVEFPLLSTGYIGVGPGTLFASSQATYLSQRLGPYSSILPASVAMPALVAIVSSQARNVELDVSAILRHGIRPVVGQFEGFDTSQAALSVQLPDFIRKSATVLEVYSTKRSVELAAAYREAEREMELVLASSAAKPFLMVSHAWQRVSEFFSGSGLPPVPKPLCYGPCLCRGSYDLTPPDLLEYLPTGSANWGYFKKLDAGSKLIADMASEEYIGSRGYGTGAVFLGEKRQLDAVKCASDCTHKRGARKTTMLGCHLETTPVVNSSCDAELLRGFLKRQIGYPGIVETRDPEELFDAFRTLLFNGQEGLTEWDLGGFKRDTLGKVRSLNEEYEFLRRVTDGRPDYLIRSIDPLTIHEWSMVTGSKVKDVIVTLHEHLESSPCSASVTTIKVNGKNEYIGVTGPGREPVTKAGRVISDRHKATKIDQIPFGRPLSKMLASLFGCYSVYRTNKETEQRLTDFAVNHPNMVSLTGDYEKQDAHTTWKMKYATGDCFALLIKLSLHCPNSKAMFDRFNASIKRTKSSCFTVGELLFIVLGTVASGDMTTTIGNTLDSILIFVIAVWDVNAARKKAGLKPRPFRDYCGNFTGDDSLVACDLELAKELVGPWEDAAKGFGHTLKVAVTWFSGVEPHNRAAFCSRVYHMDEDCVVSSFRMVGRALVRFPTSSVNGLPDDPLHPRNRNMLIAKLYSECADGGFGTPVLCGMLDGFVQRKDVALRLSTLREHHNRQLKLDHSQSLWVLGWAGQQAEGGEDILVSARKVTLGMNLQSNVTAKARAAFYDITGITEKRQISIENLLRCRCSGEDHQHTIPDHVVEELLVAGLL